jgi:hypothetical protein
VAAHQWANVANRVRCILAESRVRRRVGHQSAVCILRLAGYHALTNGVSMARGAPGDTATTTEG